MSKGESEEGEFYKRMSGHLSRGSHFKWTRGSLQPGMQMVKTAVHFNSYGSLEKKTEQL